MMGFLQRHVYKIFLTIMTMVAMANLVTLWYLNRGKVNPCTTTVDINLMDYVGNPELIEKVNDDVMSDPNILVGGHFKPDLCRIKSSQSLAIVIPFRDRQKNLHRFLPYLHYFLRTQLNEYKVYTVSQSFDGRLFNRGQLINIGFDIAMREKDWDCFIYHDVDLLPQDPRHNYECLDMPHHLNVASSKFGFALPYHSYMGGVAAIKPEQYKKANGHSNLIFGWGGEDDDFSRRLNLTNYDIVRNSAKIGRFIDLGHVEQVIRRDKPKLVEDVWRDFDQGSWKYDGLTSLEYSLVEVQISSLFTNFTVDLFSYGS